MIIGLDHIQLAAPPGCEGQAREFYGRLLGLPEIAKATGTRASGGVWFACGPQQLHIGVQDPHTPARKGHPGLLVEAGALNQLAARLQAAGHAVHWDARIPERRRFYVVDPWGNRLELTAPSADQRS